MRAASDGASSRGASGLRCSTRWYSTRCGSGCHALGRALFAGADLVEGAPEDRRDLVFGDRVRRPRRAVETALQGGERTGFGLHELEMLAARRPALIALRLLLGDRLIEERVDAEAGFARGLLDHVANLRLLIAPAPGIAVGHASTRSDFAPSPLVHAV
jgi:hypothetical protein